MLGSCTPGVRASPGRLARRRSCFLFAVFCSNLASAWRRVSARLGDKEDGWQNYIEAPLLHFIYTNGACLNENRRRELLRGHSAFMLLFTFPSLLPRVTRSIYCSIFSESLYSGMEGTQSWKIIREPSSEIGILQPSKVRLWSSYSDPRNCTAHLDLVFFFNLFGLPN
jgi:hypothetical protein